MEIYDLQDGTLKQPHLMWQALKKRSGLGRNSWHERASAFTNRVLSPVNNLSAVLKGRRKMPLHDIVPMLSAFELPPDRHNHYVREFLKCYLPQELLVFFNAADTSKEAQLLRDANANMHHVLNNARSEMAHASLWNKAFSETRKENDLLDPNAFSDFSTNIAESEMDSRNSYWISLSISYVQYASQSNTEAITFLNEYFYFILPVDWRDKLYTEVNNDVLNLIQYDAPSTQMTFLDHCLHALPLKCILSKLLLKWQKLNPEASSEILSSWNELPDNTISRDTSDVFEFKKFKSASNLDSEGSKNEFLEFRGFLEQYLGKLFEYHPSPLNSINPLHDFYGSEVMELKLIGEFKHYVNTFKGSTIEFDEFCSFGFPSAKKNPNIFREMSEIIISGLLRLDEEILLQPLLKCGRQRKDIKALQRALTESTKLKLRIPVVRLSSNYSQYLTIERLILSLPIDSQNKYRARVKKSIDRIISNNHESGIFTNVFNKLGSDIIHENLNVFIDLIDNIDEI